MVKIELGKRDFIWIFGLIVLVGVGFVYGFGGSEPSVMGHTAGEVNWSGFTFSEDIKAQLKGDTGAAGAAGATGTFSTTSFSSTYIGGRELKSGTTITIPYGIRLYHVRAQDRARDLQEYSGSPYSGEYHEYYVAFCSTGFLIKSKTVGQAFWATVSRSSIENSCMVSSSRYQNSDSHICTFYCIK